MSKHKHYDMIVEWAADTSRPVQFRRGDDRWRDVVGDPSWLENTEYRFADSVLKYRVALFDDGSEQWAQLTDTPEEAADFETGDAFVRWLTDWTEVTDPPVEKPEPKKYEVWVNLFDDGTVSERRSQEEADRSQEEAYRMNGSTRCECRHIEWVVPA